MVKKFRSKDNKYRFNFSKKELQRMQLYYLLKCA